MNPFPEKLSRLGKRLGDWNDRHSNHDTRSERTLRYRVLDRISGWLYTLPDRPFGRVRG